MGRKWSKKSHTTALGFTISATGDTSYCRDRLRRQFNGAFWANSKILLDKKCAVAGRLRFWRSLSKGIGDSRYASWPVQSSAMQEVDAVMNKFIALIVGMRPREDETAKQFAVRRNKSLARTTSDGDLRCSRHWAYKVTTWLEHCQRHQNQPSGRLLRCQDPEWLRHQRALAGGVHLFGTADAGVTRTRAGPGKPVRYLGLWYDLLNFDNPCQDRGQSKETANLLWTAARYGQLHGVAMREEQ